MLRKLPSARTTWTLVTSLTGRTGSSLLRATFTGQRHEGQAGLKRTPEPTVAPQGGVSHPDQDGGLLSIHTEPAAYLNVLTPVLQQCLLTTLHTTEELVHLCEVWHPVLIQQVVEA